jgi:hypothetical protein
MLRRLIPAAVLAIGLLGGACTSIPGGGATGSPPGADGPVLVVEPGSAGGPGISVEDALARIGGDPVLVNGSLFVDQAGTMLLCGAIAESFPPQCGGARIEVLGLDLDAIPDVQEANGVRWVESLQVFGRVAG